MSLVTGFRTGKGGRVKVDSTFMVMNTWSVSESGNEQDTTNFESYTDAYGNTGLTGRTFSQGLISIETATAQVSGNWNATQNPFANPPAIYLRDFGPRTLLSTNRNDATQFYDFLVSLINACTVACDVKGLVTFNWSFKNNGPYVRPAGVYA